MYHRFDLYGPVHKGIRFALSGLCHQAGSEDSTNDEKVQSFIEEFKRVVIILESHSKDEDDYFHEHIQKYAPDTLQELEEEHSGLDQKLGRLIELVNRLESEQSADRSETWYRIGKDLNRFTAEYLTHLEREEGPGMQALWANMTDAQLMELSANLRAAIPPYTMSIFMYYMIPSISHQQRVEMFSGMKKFAPPAAFEANMKLAESRLDKHRWTALQAALEAV